MCRLAAVVGNAVDLSRWFERAENGLVSLSLDNADGVGVGFFDNGYPRVFRDVNAAHASAGLSQLVRRYRPDVAVGHVRMASSGSVALENTHPFQLRSSVLRTVLFAQNGGFRNVDQPMRGDDTDFGELDAELGDYRSQVHGSTDSERMGALLMRNIDQADGNVTAASAHTVNWLGEHMRPQSLNYVMATRDGLVAVRSPWRNTLGYAVVGPRDDASTGARLIVASEPPENLPDWTELRAGQLLHATPDGRYTVETL